jgi:hypothetical protein
MILNSSVVECLSDIHETLGLISGTSEKKKKRDFMRN